MPGCPGQDFRIVMVIREPVAIAAANAELPFAGVVFGWKRAPQGVPVVVGVEARGAWDSSQDAALAVRRAKQQMIQGLDG
jgi:hypothetical protein